MMSVLSSMMPNAIYVKDVTEFVLHEIKSMSSSDNGTTQLPGLYLILISLFLFPFSFHFDLHVYVRFYHFISEYSSLENLFSAEGKKDYISCE